MKLLLEYLKERENIEYVEKNDFCFTYIINNEYFYLKDAYVKPEFRNKGMGLNLLRTAYEEALNKNCRFILASIDKKMDNIAVLKILEKEKFKLYNKQNELIVLIKEL